MQLANTNRHFDTSVDSPIHQAQIIATPQMFKILYDQLYTQKELAVTRELITNAWDAHVAAGTTHIPISVHLPTVLEPWFEVRDSGTGLAKDDVIQLYMDYGRSTKTHTNSMIGGFGLGSKSPFAYTDQFTVVSRFNGIAYTFQAFLQQNGAPGCMLVSENPTNAHNGLTVRVETRNSSFYDCQFKASLEKMYPYIPTPPDVNIELTNQKPAKASVDSLDGKHPLLQGIRVVDDYYNVVVVQGLVPYPVARDRISSALHQLLDEQDSAFANRMRGIVIQVPIGTFEVTASRESLSLSDTVITKLAETLRDAYKILHTELVRKLKESKTWYEWAEARKVLYSNTTLPEHLLEPPLVVEKPKIWHLTDGASNYITECRKRYTRRGNFKPSTWSQDTVQTDYNGKTIFVRDKDGRSYKHQLIDHFADPTTTSEDVFILTGDIAVIKQNLKTLGLECDVRPLPPAPRKKQATKRYGAARYFAKVGVYRNGELIEHVHFDSLDNLISQLDDENTRFTTTVDLNAFEHYQSSGLGTAPFDRICKIQIPEHHKRVEERLRNHHENYIDQSDLLNEIEWDHDAIAWAVAMHQIYKLLNDNHNPSHNINQEILNAMLNESDSHSQIMAATYLERMELFRDAREGDIDLPPFVAPEDYPHYAWLVDMVRHWLEYETEVVAAFKAKYPAGYEALYTTTYKPQWASAFFQLTKQREDNVLKALLKE